MSSQISGYTYGTSAVPPAPITLSDLDLIFRSLLLSEEDLGWLRKAQGILKPQVEKLLDVWYGFVGSNPHLLYYFTDSETSKPIGEYLEAVRKRFGQWVLDLTSGAFDQDWLNYQFEIGRRHHRSGKNRTDNVSSVAHIPFRYLMALVYPIFITVRPFLEKGDNSRDEVDKMHQAWLKAVLLSAILWAYPYVTEGDF
ncbi:MAG: protoglobin domain-containing protein [bacterium]